MNSDATAASGADPEATQKTIAPTPQRMRSFMAIEVPEEIRTELAAAQSRLERVGVNVKWVRRPEIHITLEFLGDVAECVFPPVKAAMDRAAASVKTFEYTVRGLGYFGKSASPRVVWAGVEEATGALVQLHSALVVELNALWIATDPRPFQPHVTLGRVRTPHGARRLADAIDAWNARAFGRVRAGEVVLFGSRLTPTGPIYTALHRAAFVPVTPS